MASTSIISSWSPRRGAEHAPVQLANRIHTQRRRGAAAGAGHFPRIRAAVPTAQLWLVATRRPRIASAGERRDHVTGNDAGQARLSPAGSGFVSPLRLGAGIKNKVLEALGALRAGVATALSVDGIAVRDGEKRA